MIRSIKKKLLIALLLLGGVAIAVAIECLVSIFYFTTHTMVATGTVQRSHQNIFLKILNLAREKNLLFSISIFKGILGK